jgi:hypothetical protein
MMSDTGFLIDDLDLLPLPVVATDRMLVGRSGDIKRIDKPSFRGSPGVRAQCVVPLASDFSTWVNQNGSVITDGDYTMSLYHDNTVTGGDQLSCRVRSLPGGSWDVRLGIICQWRHHNFISGGICLRESSSGKLLVSQYGHISDALGLVRWNSPTSFNTIVKQEPVRPQKGFVRFLKNGSNIEFYVSQDGVYYSLFTTIALTTAFTTAPDQWGIYLNPFNSGGDAIDPRIDAFHWSE